MYFDREVFKPPAASRSITYMEYYMYGDIIIRNTDDVVG